ncbi:UDP-2,3-diacetamido-2,3-dideoxy-D-glucuronate 2-epimerase [subsurface metagenome]
MKRILKKIQKMKKRKIFLVAGARPNFMKIAPLWRELKKFPSQFSSYIIHTGQHYDYEMSRIFFKNLGLPRPHFYLGVGSASHAKQTAKIMVKFEKVVCDQMPDIITVVGDVNSTLACSLVAAKLRVPLAHVEAGLRSFDREMPEEINRVVADALSDYLFTTCEDANRNLRREGIPQEKIFFVGNVMIDTLLSLKREAQGRNTWKTFGLRKKGYALLTLHRPENVDKKEVFVNILEAFKDIGNYIPIIFPIHPRATKQIRKFKLGKYFSSQPNSGNFRVKPLGYIDFLNLMCNSKFVLTDSGGIQEETTVLNIPCLTLRKNTERPVTVTEGTNIVVGADPRRIIREATRIINGKEKKGGIPPLWEGKAAQRIVKILLNI